MSCISNVTRRSQHSQECKDPRRQCFCKSWPCPLSFWLQNKWVSSTHRETFYVKFGDPSCIGFWDIVRKNDREAAVKTLPATAVGVHNDFLLMQEFISGSTKVRTVWDHSNSHRVAPFCNETVDARLCMRACVRLLLHSAALFTVTSGLARRSSLDGTSSFSSAISAARSTSALSVSAMAEPNTAETMNDLWVTCQARRPTGVLNPAALRRLVRW